MAKSVVKSKPRKKPAAKKAVVASPKPKTVLVLRTCDKDLKSHGGFQWPASGPVECPDWSPVASCGNGLHGLLWGEGDGSLLDWSPEAKWLVVEVIESDIVAIGRKVKFPRGVVVFCGDRLGATDFIVSRLTKSASVVGACIRSGDGGTSTSGYRGTSTSGDGGTSTSGYGGTLVLTFWDGKRKRLVVAYVGENGIEPNKKYTINDKREVVEVK